MGLLLYYLKFSLVNNTLPINALSIGQRDVNPSIQSLTIRGLEAQKYDADLNNPTNLLLGNIDFSFVLIFLFPLLIIAFTYNIISEEKESGTWRIVLIQSRSPFLFILQLFSVRLLVVLLVLVVTLFAAVIFLQIPLDAVFWAYLITSILYVLCWFGVCFWVTSLHKSSNFNAVLLLSIWIFLIIILPASINNYLVNKYPTPEALETTLKQRKGYHEKWDMDKQATVDKFYKHYPQYSKFKMPEGDFNWLWYYAMQQMGDDESMKQSTELREKLQKRNEISANIAQFIPTIHLQIQLNELAKSGLQNQLLFLDEMNKFHERNRLYFYPKIFSESPVNAENWDKFKVQTFKDKSTINYPKIFLPLLAFILLFGGLAWANFKDKITVLI
jgi:ABC-2 type transport system permease protein